MRVRLNMVSELRDPPYLNSEHTLHVTKVSQKTTTVHVSTKLDRFAKKKKNGYPIFTQTLNTPSYNSRYTTKNLHYYT